MTKTVFRTAVRRRFGLPAGLIGLAAALAVLASACGGSSHSTSAQSNSTTTTSGAARGGVYRVGWEKSFGFTDNFDPTGEYLGEAFGIYSNLLIRTLIGYDHVAGAAGNKLVPDLATSVPKPTNGGKTYTFHLKSGVRFGPPVNREITSRDILYAIERLAKPSDGAEYSFYYKVIKGFDAYGAGKASTITGIQTPNAKTIVFHLTKPAGDFLYRMAMPATGPIPVEIAKCFEGKPGRYGRDLVSSGPYMIAGMGKVNDSSCATLRPASGFDGQTIMTLVRNPNYDPKTDSASARQSLPNRFVFTVDASADDILNKIQAGQLDDEISSIPPQVLRSYSTSSSLKQYFHQNSADRTWYLTMNITQPPFDDVHVRRALNWVMDKYALRQAWGGPTAGSIADHIAPDTMFDNQLTEFGAYTTPDGHGSLAKAKAALKGSRYDTRHNGTCSAPQCKGVLLLADTRAVDTKMLPVIEASAKKIGITFDIRTINGAYPTIQTPSKNIPIAERTGWGKDYADPITFFEPLFDGRTIIPNGNTNYSLVGITGAQCKKLGITGDCKPFDRTTGIGVPNVNAQLDRCVPLTGQRRLSCYEDLDRTLTTKVVPWVPYLWQDTIHITSSNVKQWSYDQFSGSIGYAHVAVA